MSRSGAFLASMTFSTVAAAAVAPAGAEPITVTGEPEEVLVSVPYADLQLTRSVDQNALVSRVRRANHSACVEIYSSWYDSAGMSCEHLAWQAARPQIDSAIANARMAQTASTSSIVIRLSR